MSLLGSLRPIYSSVLRCSKFKMILVKFEVNIYGVNGCIRIIWSYSSTAETIVDRQGIVIGCKDAYMCLPFA